MGYVTPEQITQAKELDLLTYLQRFDPQELVHVSGSTYCTREHDSLKISNGKWNWFSRGIGGKTALDYLIKVQGFSFTQAVEALVGQNFSPLPHAPQARPKKQEPRVLSLPKSSRCATHMVSYLHGRGIDYDVIDYCIQTGRLYESLLRSREVSFTFRGKTYQAEIAGADVFPQGFAAVASQIRDFQGVNMLCDIGNGTMNIMFINDRRPAADRMFTEKYGTHQCMLAVRENVMRTHHATVDDSIINRVLRFGTADIQEDYLTTIRETAAGYVREIFRILREREYNPALMRLHVLGGGSCLIRNFGEYDADRVTIYDDICATAKGYEYLCEQALRRGVRE